MPTALNADPAELEKFSDLAHRWWDPESEFKPLHEINPLRLDWIERLAAARRQATSLDVGCGGGILAEAMARRGAASPASTSATSRSRSRALHLLESGLEVRLRARLGRGVWPPSTPASFDVVTCMEMLEHVPDPASAVAACAQLVKPGGTAFFSTINRNPKSYLFAVIGAEYVLKLLPKGTHDYARFIRPSELARGCRDAGLREVGAGRHDVQPAHAALPARSRLRRELPALLPA